MSEYNRFDHEDGVGTKKQVKEIIKLKYRFTIDPGNITNGLSHTFYYTNEVLESP